MLAAKLQLLRTTRAMPVEAQPVLRAKPQGLAKVLARIRFLSARPFDARMSRAWSAIMAVGGLGAPADAQPYYLCGGIGVLQGLATILAELDFENRC